jgi:hypothetical protein
MIHVRRCFTETSSAQFDPLLFVQLVTYSDINRIHERPRARALAWRNLSCAIGS